MSPHPYSPGASPSDCFTQTGRASIFLVDESDRDVLSVFAEGLGIAFERNLLLDRLKALQSACNEYAQGVDALVDDCYGCGDRKRRRY